MFEGVVVDDDTGFQNAEVDGCRIERHVLERLNNYGDLTRGRLMTMVIVDPVVTLRSYYSGFWQWIHVMALTLFLAPYVVFVAREYALASFHIAGDSITLLHALGRYIWTGGGEHAFACWPSAGVWFSFML